MNKSIERLAQIGKLRATAEAKLKERTTPPDTSSLMGIEALALLYGLASTPDRAADALKLLHELQVHQVELDLMQAQLESNHRTMTDDLARYKGAYELAPFGCFILDLDGRILKANLAGARVLGIEPDQIPGCTMADLLPLQSRPAFESLLQQHRDGHAEASCEAQSLRDGADTHAARMRMTGRLLPDQASVLLVVTE